LTLRRNLELMLERGQDSPLLRFSLGQECLKSGDLVTAIDHLRQAVDQNPRYSAAWKALGDAHARAGPPNAPPRSTSAASRRRARPATSRRRRKWKSS
jgi:uncharacterized protein HemY